jgi:aminoglycoside phosphotransferase (APT) family kinase protein
MFAHTENFAGIIRNATGAAPAEIAVEPTGWTNIVILAKMPDGDFFFRFPRDSFWDFAIEKDHAFCKYINGRTSFATPDMELLHDNGRPFSRHRKILGRTLTSAVMAGDCDMRRFADGVARFLSEMAALNMYDMPDGCKMPASEFFLRLAENHFDAPDMLHYEKLLKYEQEGIIASNNDMNPGNILLDDDGNVAGILDFAFSGLGGRAIDLSRIIGRMPKSFADPMAAAAERFGLDANPAAIADLIETWNYVETSYIAFMKKNHPEIQLPPGV